MLNLTEFYAVKEHHEIRGLDVLVLRIMRNFCRSTFMCEYFAMIVIECSRLKPLLPNEIE